MKRGTIKHPKVDRLMASLGVNRREAVGLLQMLWDWAGEYAAQGDVGRWSDAAIANAVEWPVMEHERLIGALISSGWLDKCEAHRLVIHDWEEHCEEFIRKRLKRQGLWFVAVNSSAVRQNPPNGSLPSPAQPSPAPSGDPPNVGWSPAGGWTGISAREKENWKVAFPACNLDRQLAAMHEWLLSNPDRAHKTRWRRFITNWLGRAQDRGGDIGNAGRQVKSTPRANADFAINQTRKYLDEQEQIKREVQAERAARQSQGRQAG